jgi:hypothetical protein
MRNRRFNSPRWWLPSPSYSIGGGFAVVIALILGFWIGFSIGFGIARQTQPVTLKSTITTPQTPIAAPIAPSEIEVRIDYLGNKGRKFSGVYWINVPTDGVSAKHYHRNLEGELPKSVTLRVRSDAYIAASMNTVGNQNGVVKIFKNGQECDYDRVDGFDHGKACSPKSF